MLIEGAKFGEYGECGKVTHLNEIIVSLFLMCRLVLSCSRRTLSMGKISRFQTIISSAPRKRVSEANLRQWRGSENCSHEVAQRTVDRILRDRDTCSHSKGEYCYREKRLLCWEAEMWSIENQLLFKWVLHVPVTVIIPGLKKKRYFLTYLCIYFGGMIITYRSWIFKEYKF